MKTKIFMLVAVLGAALAVAGGAFASTISQSSDQSNMTGQLAYAGGHHGSGTATNTNTSGQGNVQIVVASGYHTPNVSQSSDQSNGTLQGAITKGGGNASNSNTSTQGSLQVALLGRYGNH